MLHSKIYPQILVDFIFQIFFDITIDILQEVMNDKDDWLMYFVYERDWLRDMKLGDVTVGDEPIQIKTWEDVYDFITEVNKHGT